MKHSTPPRLAIHTSKQHTTQCQIAWSAVRRSTEKLFCVLAIALFATPFAQAQLNIDITGVGQNQISFTVAPFVGNEGLPEDIKTIVQNDLTRSGFFKAVTTTSNVVLDENSLIDPTAWKSIGVDAVVAGSVKKLSDGRLEIRYNIHDTVQQKSLGRFGYIINPNSLRLESHRIADVVYEKFLGEPGIFATRLAYVERSGNSHKLIIADSDGANPQVALASKEPIISPSWSPDGSQLAYVSFETRKPVVFVHTLATGKRRAVANYRGSNSAPAWAPNGQTMAVVLTKDNGSQIYTMNLSGGSLTRITNTGTINTEPFYSNDGKNIYFTSDRGGAPQIYRMDTSGGNVQRVTFSGNYNISPRVSPDNKTLTYVTRRDGNFRIATLDLQTGAEAILTETDHDESPSFAPNGRFILYATRSRGKGVLAMVSKDARVKQQLVSSSANIGEPTWGPFLGKK
ncbi:MAG: Tol-Pal system protein TolB [Limnobacter sp.]|nr:Tol-Pal system protein TolB [Limnobacter sp.]